MLCVTNGPGRACDWVLPRTIAPVRGCCLLRARGSCDRSFACAFPVACATHSFPAWRDARVLVVVFMPLGAMRLVSERVVLPHRVLAGSNNLKVFRVAAGAVATQVIELHAWRDWFVVVVLPHDAVNDAVGVAWASPVLAVAVRCLVTCPFPAAVSSHFDLALHAGEFAGIQSPCWMWHARMLPPLELMFEMG